MKKRVALLVVFAAALIAAGCGGKQPEESQQGFQWRVKGKIVSVDAAAKRIRIDHENISGLMGAMTMTFPVEDAAVLDGLEAGAAVEFELTQTSRGLVVTAVRKIDPALLGQDEGVKSYSGQGTIVVVNRKAAAVVLRHEAIPGTMPAGELVLEVRPASLLEGIEDGSDVEFTLTEYPNELVMTGLKKRE